MDDLEFYKQEAFKNPEVQKAYDDLAPEYEILQAIIDARKAQHITQKELSRRTRIPQAHISRIERGVYNPSLKMLKRVAAGLNKELHIEFR